MFDSCAYVGDDVIEKDTGASSNPGPIGMASELDA
jgi:hypothetical protein